jgi:transcriptional regulator GlxA family with amidase domain
MISPPSSPHRIAIVIYPEFKALEAIGPMSVFGYANHHLQAARGTPAYELLIAAPERGPVPSDTLMSLDAAHALDQLDRVDSVLIVGAPCIEKALTRHPELVRWIRRVQARVGRLAGLCSGSFFLAEAGVLDGRRATTHWSVAALMRQRYPRIDVDADAIYIQQEQVWTSAGVTAAMDMALAFVERDHGRELALAVARDLVVYLKRPGGQSQFSSLLKSQSAGSVIGEVQAWMLAHLERAMDVGTLARRASMSERNFSRLFQREVGQAPMQFLESARIERARLLFEDSSLSLKAVALRAGFSTEQQMRRAFLRRLAVSPSDYRERFSPVGALP